MPPILDGSQEMQIPRYARDDKKSISYCAFQSLLHVRVPQISFDCEIGAELVKLD